VPAERFHGQTDQVLSNLGEGVDITKGTLDIERSILNLVLNSHGDLTFYLMGKPIRLTGGHDGRANV